MSLGLSKFVSQNANALGLPAKARPQEQKKQQKGTDKLPKPRSKGKTKSRSSSAKGARPHDPYGKRPSGSRRSTHRRVIRLRRRVGGGLKPNGGTQYTNHSGQSTPARGGADPQGPSNQAAHHMMRASAEGDLQKMSSKFLNSQTSQHNKLRSALAQKRFLLGACLKYQSLDRSCKKLNPRDTSGCYTLGEGRHLCAMLGTILASTGSFKKKDCQSSKPKSKAVSPEVFSRFKSLLRRLGTLPPETNLRSDHSTSSHTPLDTVA